MSLPLLAVLVLLAFAVETAAGFGSTVILLTVGGLVAPIEQLMVVVVPVNLVVSAVVLLRDRRAARLGLLLRGVMPAMLLGLGVGVAMSSLLVGPSLQRAYALFVVLLAGRELLGTGANRPPSPRATFGWLAMGGVAHGAFAASGPLVVYAMGRELADKREFRATLAALWLALNGVLVASYLVRGAATLETARSSALLLPASVVGILVGERLHRSLSGPGFRRAVFALMLAGGLVLFVAAR